MPADTMIQGWVSIDTDTSEKGWVATGEKSSVLCYYAVPDTNGIWIKFKGWHLLKEWRIYMDWRTEELPAIHEAQRKNLIDENVFNRNTPFDSIPYK